MKILETERDPRETIVSALTAEAAGPDEQVAQAVRNIIADVKARGDEALIELGRKFDSADLTDLKVDEQEMDEACRSVDQSLLDAIRTAKANIETYHRNQLRQSWFDMREGSTYGQIVRPLDTVGVYAPSGQAPLPSTVLMTAVPASVAGVRRIILCSPSRKDGRIDAAMLAAARECGVSEVFKVGGAQAAAAMAFGTRTVPRVDKIVGPGNPYFIEGKRQVHGIVGIDQLAGPSEIMVIADETARPEFVAADVLSQAEHAPDSRCVVATNSRQLANRIIEEIKNQAAVAARSDVIRRSLDDYGIVVIARDVDECVELANIFAPEHLELAVAEPWDTVRKVRNAGTVMLGHYTPVPLCDFAAGPNHTLPTNGTARFGSPLGVDDFIKKTGLLEYTRGALGEIAPTVLEIAKAEGLDAHANTIRVRTAGLDAGSSSA
jgi:histidinol dehydrogenase